MITLEHTVRGEIERVHNGAGREAGMSPQAVFRCQDRDYAARHVLASAAFHGEMAGVREALRNTLACAGYAAEHGYELDDAALQAASEAYRAARGLVTAQATALWLEARDVSIEDFSECLERRLWRQRFADDLDWIRSDYAPPFGGLPSEGSAEAEIERLLWIEAALDDAFDPWALWLARRVALMAECGGNASIEKEAKDEETARFLARAGITPEGADHRSAATWLSVHRCDAAWFGELIDLEVLYRQKRHALLTPANFSREMQVRRLALIRIDVEAAAFPAEDIAQEACWCVAEDGDSLEEVCARAGGTRYHASVFLERLPSELQQQFLSASGGQVFRPVKQEDRYWIYRVRRKMEPDMADPEVQEQLAHALVTKYFDELVDKHIQWFLRKTPDAGG
jgi:hypothetical protein